MKFFIVCRYCDHKMTRVFYDHDSAKGIRCDKCGDRNLDIRLLSVYRVDTYAGAPPFDTNGNVNIESTYGYKYNK